MFGSLSRPSYWVLMVFALTVIATVSASYEGYPDFFERRDHCTSRGTCHECIQTPQCAWCSAPRFTRSRCSSINSRILSECPEQFIQNPDNRVTLLRGDKLTKANSSAVNGHSHEDRSSSNSFSSSSDDRRQETVQLSPQELKLELRKYQPYNISFSYARADDFPVDIYYLINFREPIKNGTNNVIKLGELLVESVRNVTSNFRVGSGSTISYSDPYGRLEDTRGFKKIMDLSQDARMFATGLQLLFNHSQNLVPHYTSSYNCTASDKGLDVILQALVCRDKIRWRPETRKILVFATDTELPENIDTLVEAMRPNNELCRLYGNEFPPYLQRHDYSSTSQISQVIKQEKINIIWAVTEEHYSQFSRLSQYVEGSITQKLSDNSITISELIRELYQSISTSVEVEDTASSDVKVKYFSSCGLENGNSMLETAKCKGLKVGTNVEFFAEIEAIACPTNKSEWKQKFNIYPVGIDENLTVDLRLICGCDCENPSHPLYETQSAMCFGGGTLKCGVCECNDGYFGSRCECSTSSVMTDQSCKFDNNSLFECSGRGNCLCGNCDCELRTNPDEVISGRYCECDNFSCDRDNGKLCSDHGTCSCGQCVCNSGWNGPACQHTDTETQQEVVIVQAMVNATVESANATNSQINTTQEHSATENEQT